MSALRLLTIMGTSGRARVSRSSPGDYRRRSEAVKRWRPAPTEDFRAARANPIYDDARLVLAVGSPATRVLLRPRNPASSSARWDATSISRKTGWAQVRPEGIHRPMSFNMFNLHPDLLRSVADLGFETPTPIQRDAIPPAVAGR